jgi:zinc ribbon protein
MAVGVPSEDACTKCGNRVDANDRFCRYCGKAQVFVEMAVWKQFLLAIGTLVGLFLVVGAIFIAVEGIESDVEAAVAEAAGGRDTVEGVDCQRSSGDAEFEDRYRCKVTFYSAPCERWTVIVAPGRKLEAAQSARARDC